MVRNNTGPGIQIGSSTADSISGIRIFGSSIANNGGLGIDLPPIDTVNPNDPNDADLGPNGLQNAPVLTSATWVGRNQLRVQGTLDGELSGAGGATYTIEFYATSLSDPEGHTSLLAQTYTPDGVGDVVFDETVFFSGTFDAVTATASENDSYFGITETSEFSNALAAQLECTVTTTNDSGPGSLRQAIQSANAGVCLDVVFNIPGAGPTFVIQPLTPLDAITLSGLIIDGTTQALNNGDTNPSGPEIVLDGQNLLAGHGLHIDASASFVDNIQIRGLVIQNFPGDGIRVDGGSFGSSGHTISDSYIGTDATGTSGAGNGGHGIGLFGSVTSTLVGGDPFAGTSGNLIGGNAGFGIYAGISSGGNEITGNVIGADRTGTSPIPNVLGGVYLDTSFNTMGFSFSRSKTSATAFGEQFSDEQLAERPALRESLERQAARAERRIAAAASREGSVETMTSAPMALPSPSGNIIAFNGSHGITLDAGANNNVIVLNWIHSNGGDGVHLTSTAGAGNTIEENSIERNAALGINIVPGASSTTSDDANGVLINDGLELFGNPNDELDHPKIIDAVYDGSVTTITYTFASTAGSSATYDFLFYSSPVADPSGYGEGEAFLIRDSQSYSLTAPDGTQQHVVAINADLRKLWITGTTTNPGNSTSEFSSAVLVRALDVGITKTGPATAFVNTPMSYTLTVQNFGPDAPNVVVTDTLPAGSTFSSVGASSLKGTVWTCAQSSPGVVTCTTPTMVDNDTSTINIVAFAPPAAGVATNNASVSTTGANVDSTNDAASFQTTVTSAELSITKTDAPDPVRVGQPLTYTVTVTNSGTAPASAVQVTDSLDPNVVFVSAGNPEWTCSLSGTSVSCTYVGGKPTGSLSGTSSFPIVVTPTAAGSVSNTAFVSTEVPESNSGDNSVTIITTVDPKQSDLALTKSGPASVAAGAPISWTLTVVNNGPDAASSVVVTDTLPAGATFQSAGSSPACALTGTSGGSQIVTCTASLIASGGSTTFTITATAPATTGPAVNSAFVSSASTDPATGNDSTSFTTTVNPPGADLKLDKTGPLTAEPNDTFAYTLTVMNRGPANAADVTITDTLPSGITYLGSPEADWLCSESSPGLVTCSLFAVPLVAGDSSTVTLSVRGPGIQTTLTNSATVSSTTTDPDKTNNASSATTSFTSPCPDEGPALVAPASGATGVSSPVTFRWLAIEDAIGYQVLISTSTGATETVATVDGSAPAGEEMSVEATVPDGRVIWWVRANFGFGCRPADSLQRVFFSTQCPNERPELLDVVEGNDGEVTLRWTRVEQALRYHVLLATDGGSHATVGSVEQVPEGSVPSFRTVVPAGAQISWIVEVEFGDGCPRLRSDPDAFEAPCYPPVLSIPGSVTSDKEYEVRATIVSEGRKYIFEESTSAMFDRDLVSKEGQLEPDGEYIFAIFEHVVSDPTPYFYRVRVDQAGCEFSDPGRIVVIPPSSDGILQLGLEETIVREVEILSPPEELGAGFTFQVTDDREWILSVSPSSGTIGPNEILVLVVTMNPVGLPVGTTTGTIEVEFTPIAPAGKRALSSHTVSASTSVSVTLVTPVTNTGKDTPLAESLIIPAVAHADGFNSQWQSDIRLVNLGTTSQKYALNFTVSGENGTQTGKSAEIDLHPGQTTALNDLVRQWFGLGALPGENTTGVFEIRPLARGGITSAQTEVTKSLVSLASSRTYNKTSQGTLGQFIPAIPFAGFVGKTPPEAAAKTILSLQQLAQNDSYRTNLGLVEASGNAVQVQVRFYDANGTKLLEVRVALLAGEHLQINEILKKNGVMDLDIGRAEVEVLDGDGMITAYASVIDNLTNDPLLVQAVNLAEIGADKYVVPGVAHYETGQARWRSDMQIFNAEAAPVEATLSFFRQGETTPAQTAQITVQPGAITSLGDVIATVFGESNTGGSVHVTTTGTSKLVVTARTYDQTESRTYGQFIPAVTEAQAFGVGDRPMQVLQMEQSPDFRTNLGIVEVTGQPVQIELTAHVAESRVTPRVQVTLQGNEFRQLDKVLQSLNVGNTYNARVALRVIGGQGKIAAYASAIDNKTQDPTYVPGQ